MGTKRSQVDSRRNFLKGVAIGAGAVAVSVAGGGAVAGPPREAPKSSESKGYRMTDHIRDYYRTAGM